MTIGVITTVFVLVYAGVSALWRALKGTQSSSDWKDSATSDDCFWLID